MKLSEFKNEEALELVADILDPASRILADKRFKTAYSAKGETIIKATRAAKVALKHHSKDVLEILARLNKCDPSEFEVNAIQIPAMLVDVLSDDALVDLFMSAEQMEDETPSGSASENTEDHET